MNPNKALWEKGDFTRIAATMRESGEELVGPLGITPGMNVLDLGCGDGTTALPAARLGADVLGVDIAGNLVDAGNRRAQDAGLTNCRFQEGDATNLGELADRSFDLVVSIFGAMFAPKPFDVAREMVRVTRPGGRIVMGNWIPNDPTLVAQILKISSSYSPPPPEGFVSPMTGYREPLIERFAAAGIPAGQISFSRDTYPFNFPGAPAAFLADFRIYYGPTMNVFAAAEQNGKAADLQQELEALFERENRSQAKDATSIPRRFSASPSPFEGFTAGAAGCRQGRMRRTPRGWSRRARKRAPQIHLSRLAVRSGAAVRLKLGPHARLLVGGDERRGRPALVALVLDPDDMRAGAQSPHLNGRASDLPLIDEHGGAAR